MRLKLAAVITAVAAAGATAAVLSAERSGAEPKTRDAPSPEISARDVSDLVIRDREGEVRLARHGGSWRLVAPVDDRADRRRVEEALAALARLELGDAPVAAKKGAWPRYEVAEDEVITAIVTQGGRTLPALHLGRSGFVRVGDDPRIYEVPEFRRKVLDRDVTAWRDLAVLDPGDDEVTAVEVIDAEGRRARADRAPGTERAAARALPPDAWVLTAGADHAEPFDPAVPASLVRYLLALRGDGVAEGPAAVKALDDPPLRIRLYSEARVRELIVGGRVNAKTALGLSGSDRIWLLSHPQAQHLARGPRQWRHKHAVSAEPGEIAAIEVDQGGRRLRVSKENRWVVEVPAGATIDGPAAESYARRFSPLTADAVAHPEAVIPEGAATLSLELRNGEVVRIAIGERDDGTFVLASSERPDLLLLHRQRAVRLLSDAFTLIRRRE